MVYYKNTATTLHRARELIKPQGCCSSHSDWWEGHEDEPLAGLTMRQHNNMLYGQIWQPPRVERVSMLTFSHTLVRLRHTLHHLRCSKRFRKVSPSHSACCHWLQACTSSHTAATFSHSDVGINVPITFKYKSDFLRDHADQWWLFSFKVSK